MRTILKISVLGFLIMVFGASAFAGNWRVLTTEFEVKAPVEKAWKAWTTAVGVKTFFTPDCFIEPQVDGAYEIFFFPGAKPGERGSEGMRILSLEPMSRFAFTWSAPPHIPDIRRQRTMVILEFKAITPDRTWVRFTESGWGDGSSWDEAYEFFDHAWNAVLSQFRYAMEVGPIDWKKPPKLEPVTRTLKLILSDRLPSRT